MVEGDVQNGDGIVSMQVEGAGGSRPEKPDNDEVSSSTRIIRILTAALIGINFIFSGSFMLGVLSESIHDGAGLFYYLMMEAIVMLVLLILSAFTGRKNGRFIIWSLLSFALPVGVVLLKFIIESNASRF